MANKILVNVIITTYDRDGSRTPLLIDTLDSLFSNLWYPNLHYIIADNDSPNKEHIQNTTSFIVNRSYISMPSWEVLVTPNALGVGGSKNAALRKAFETSPVVLLLEDDWTLQYSLDIIPYVQLLLDREDISMFRMGYLGGEGIIAKYVDLVSPFLSGWQLQRGSHVYVYSGQVSLRHQRFYDVVGYHEEGISPGAEELEMCKRFNGAEGVGDIYWPAPWGCQFNTGPFHNIGTGSMSLNAKEPE